MMLFLLTSIFLHLLPYTAAFHIPNLSVSTDVDASSHLENHGLINSQIRQNWSQSLHIGSISISAVLLTLVVVLCMYLRLWSNQRQQRACLLDLKEDFTKFKRELASKACQKWLRCASEQACQKWLPRVCSLTRVCLALHCVSMWLVLCIDTVNHSKCSCNGCL